MDRKQIRNELDKLGALFLITYVLIYSWYVLMFVPIQHNICKSEYGENYTFGYISGIKTCYTTTLIFFGIMKNYTVLPFPKNLS